jgi:hypothetical protein
MAKKGAICPIFEGDMPPKKYTPNIGAITGILLTVVRGNHLYVEIGLQVLSPVGPVQFLLPIRKRHFVILALLTCLLGGAEDTSVF